MAPFVLSAVVAAVVLGTANAAPVANNSTAPVANAPEWLARAAALQRYLGYEGLALNKASWVGTHNAYNDEASKKARLSFEIKGNQKLPILEQLKLGSRILELDAHYLASADKLVLCHIGSGVGDMIRGNCSETFGWPICNSLGLYDFGPSTGCNPDATLVSTALAEINTWLKDPANSQEFVIIKYDGQYGPKNISDLTNKTFGSILYTPADQKDPKSPALPSIKDLKSLGKSVMAVSEWPTGVLFQDFLAWLPAKDFKAKNCTKGNAEDPEKALFVVQGDTTEYNLDIPGLLSYKMNSSDNEGAVTPKMAVDVYKCGESVMFDQFDVDMLTASMWSWQDKYPSVSTEQRCAVISKATGRWQDTDCTQARNFACVNTTDRSAWSVSATAGAFATPSCPAGTQFDVPRNGLEASRLRAAVAGKKAPNMVYLAYQSEKGTDCWTAHSGATKASTYCFKPTAGQ